jgi:hypothetical protein
MALLLQTSDASRRGIVGDHTDGHLRICIFESLLKPFGPYLAEMGHWRQGLAVSRVSQSTSSCTSVFRIRTSPVIGTTGHCGVALLDGFFRWKSSIA